jgi:hypothetical protein
VPEWAWSDRGILVDRLTHLCDIAAAIISGGIIEATLRHLRDIGVAQVQVGTARYNSAMRAFEAIRDRIIVPETTAQQVVDMASVSNPGDMNEEMRKLVDKFNQGVVGPNRLYIAGLWKIKWSLRLRLALAAVVAFSLWVILARRKRRREAWVDRPHTMHTVIIKPSLYPGDIDPEKEDHRIVSHREAQLRANANIHELIHVAIERRRCWYSFLEPENRVVRTPYIFDLRTLRTSMPSGFQTTAEGMRQGMIKSAKQCEINFPESLIPDHTANMMFYRAYSSVAIAKSVETYEVGKGSDTVIAPGQSKGTTMATFPWI